MQLFSSSGKVRGRVMEIIESRIIEGEKEYEMRVQQAQNQLLKDLEEARIRFNETKKDALDDVTKSIVGKIL